MVYCMAFMRVTATTRTGDSPLALGHTMPFFASSARQEAS